MKYILIETTFDNYDEAIRLASLMLKEKLVADGQISEINSVFNFEEKYHNRKEWLLTMKTQATLFGYCEEFIKKNHSFKVPQIVATELKCGNAEYLKWIDENTR